MRIRISLVYFGAAGTFSGEVDLWKSRDARYHHPAVVAIKMSTSQVTGMDFSKGKLIGPMRALIDLSGSLNSMNPKNDATKYWSCRLDPTFELTIVRW
ncbi:hypothetical protein Q31a_11980 [Aureliella helgolandensis]|uniref:Uncharacterized protein n=1 Tax=Aureliella helgolandensis TaxID=2527968 RepID=A0A518G2X1_9BACT|nr:hypothetical protein Q31a_11980 [Aureliella helgolandensis]